MLSCKMCCSAKCARQAALQYDLQHDAEDHLDVDSAIMKSVPVSVMLLCSRDFASSHSMQLLSSAFYLYTVLGFCKRF